MPNAVGVVVIFTGHHGSVDGDAHRGHGDARQEVEDPALPRCRVALTPVPTAVHPHGGHDHKAKEAGSHQVPDAPAIHLQGHGDDQYT